MIKLIETLVYYDEPQVCVVENETWGKMLAVAIGDETPDKWTLYIAVPISHRRLQAVTNNCTTMYEAFRFPEDGAFLITLNEECVPTPLPLPLPFEWIATPGTRLFRHDPRRYTSKPRYHTRKRPDAKEGFRLVPYCSRGQHVPAEKHRKRPDNNS